jgi:hypothetical protein
MQLPSGTAVETGHIPSVNRLHPNCSATVTTNCLPPPFDGSLLQIMPWPSYHHRDVGLSVHVVKEPEDELFVSTSHDRQVRMTDTNHGFWRIRLNRE